MASMTDDIYVEEGLLSNNPSSEREEDEPLVIKSTRRHGLLYTSCCLLAGIAFSLAILSLTGSIKTASLPPAKLYQGWELNAPLRPGEKPLEDGSACGTSPQEASDLGCKFDVILYAWVPAPCFDQKIQKEFLERDMEWWLRRGGEGGKKLPQEEVPLGIAPGLWMSWEWHNYHCAFIMKQMGRVLQNSSMGIPGRLLLDHHTDHCLDVLRGIEASPDTDISTLVSMQYSTCYWRA